MPLTHLIAHHLKREAESPAQALLREGELPLNDESEALTAQLKASFLSRISREHGSFNREGDEPLLPALLAQFLKGEMDFSAISRSFTEAMQQAVEEGKAEFDAHLVFMLEKSFDQHTFSLLLARQKASLTLDSELAVRHSYAIDTGPSLFGIKVDLHAWQEQHNYAYLSLIPPRGNPALAEAFYRLTGFANGIDKEAATLAFLEGVEAFAHEVPEEQRKEYRDQVVEYCMGQEVQDEPVSLEKLSEAVEGIDPKAFVRTLSEHTSGTEDEPELVIDRRSLKRYVKFAGREKDLAISFSSYQLDQRVSYDVEADTLRISGLPKALRKQLLGHLQPHSSTEGES